MMRVAGMQPYFFPYIGYWQLIHACDIFIIFDDAQYINRGWINRNRILKPAGGWQYINAPLQKHSASEKIKNVCISQTIDWKTRIVRQLSHYKTKAPHFSEVMELISSILYGKSVEKISMLNFMAINRLARHLGLKQKIILSSDCKFDYSGIMEPDDWPLQMARQLKATDVINPIGGAKLFRPEKFDSENMKLSFLKSHEISYPQIERFEPSLSIIDVLMFNGVSGTREFLEKYHLVPAASWGQS